MIDLKAFKKALQYNLFSSVLSSLAKAQQSFRSFASSPPVSLLPLFFFAYSFASQLFEFSLQCCTLASLSIPFPLLYELFVSRQPRCSTQCEPSFVPTQQDAPACTRQENAVVNLTSGRSAHKNSDKLDSNFSV